MTAKDIFNALIESSSLRADLLNQVESALRNILDNIDLTDELCARVKDETYNFIKDYKGVQ